MEISNLKTDRKNEIVISSLYAQALTEKSYPVLFRFSLSSVPLVIAKGKNWLVLAHEDGTFLLSEKCLQKEAVTHFVGMLNARIKDEKLFLRMIESMRKGIREAKEKT